MTKFRYKIQKTLFRFIGDIRWHGLFHPLWFTINASTFRLKGKHYRSIESVIKPGDILLRRFEGYLDRFLIPGFWNHSGIYIGKIDGKDHKVVHATSDGVIVEDLIDFARTDHLVVLRAPARMKENAIKRAKRAIGKDYDFAFEFGNSLRFSCTELISHCYSSQRRKINGKKRFGRFTVVADDIANTPFLSTVWDSRKDI